MMFIIAIVAIFAFVYAKIELDKKTQEADRKRELDNLVEEYSTKSELERKLLRAIGEGYIERGRYSSSIILQGIAEAGHNIIEALDIVEGKKTV